MCDAASRHACGFPEAFTIRLRCSSRVSLCMLFSHSRPAGRPCAPMSGPERIEALYTLIRRINASVSVARRFAPQDQDDAVQHVAVALEVHGVLHRVRHPEAFIRRALSNWYLDHLPGREVDVEEVANDSTIATFPEQEDGPTAELTARRLARLRHEVDVAAREAIAARPKRFRGRARTTWKQICDLAFEGVSFDTILTRDEDVRAGTPASVRKAAELRLYQAHRRFREEMHRSIDDAEARGRISVARAALRRQCMMWLYRNGPRRAAAHEH